jgi:hypothetical protein
LLTVDWFAACSIDFSVGIFYRMEYGSKCCLIFYSYFQSESWKFWILLVNHWLIEKLIQNCLLVYDILMSCMVLIFGCLVWHPFLQNVTCAAAAATQTITRDARTITVTPGNKSNSKNFCQKMIWCWRKYIMLDC